MTKAEELADCLEGDRYYDRDGLMNLLSEAAAELRRLAALEQAAPRKPMTDDTAPLLARIAELEQAVRWEADLCQQALDSRAELESENKLLDSLMRSGEWRGVQKGLEEAASICEEKHANGNWKYDTRHECAEAIRAAMKEQP